MGRVARSTLYIAIIIQREHFRNLHVGRRPLTHFVHAVIIGFGPGVNNTPIMAGEAHFRRGRHLFVLVWNQVRTSALSEKDIHPTVMAYGASFCGTGVTLGSYLCGRDACEEYQKKRREIQIPCPSHESFILEKESEIR